MDDIEHTPSHSPDPQPDTYPDNTLYPGEPGAAGWDVPVDAEPLVPKEKGSGLRFLIDLIETILLAVILFLAINAVSARIRVDGYSMVPTLQDEEFLIVNKLAYQFDDTKRGDIIVFHFPRNPRDEYIKRIIGLPGDQIQIRSGEVWVNDQRLEEDYIQAAPAYTGSWTVPDGEIFVLGDNRNNSSDSHDWGFLPMEYVIGKAVFVYWPPTEWGAIEASNNALAAP